MAGSSAPGRLRVGGRPDPLGVDAGEVRFGWVAPPDVATQTAYRIQVDPVDADGPAWDSGTVKGGDVNAVPYAGPRLSPRTRYRWRVRVRDGEGEWSAWSDRARFETGVDRWEAEWLAPGGTAYESTPAPAPVFRTTFEADAEVKCARLYVAVGGTCEPRVNGERVTDHTLDPAQTDYEERVLYETYDVTDAVEAGRNAVALVCGRERYAMTVDNEWAWNDTPWQRPHPEVLCELTVTYADRREHTVRSDTTWRTGESATRFDSQYTGEEYDARRAGAWSDPNFDDGEWARAESVTGPAGEVVPQAMQPMEAVKTVRPDDVDRLDGGDYVVDFGRVLAGWVRLTVDAPAGTEVELAHGEKRADDGTVPVDQDHLDGAFQTDRYVCAGDGSATWEPRFTYKGFRYVQVSGLPEPPTQETVVAVECHTTIDSDSESGFQCSDGFLNTLHEFARRALVSNHHGIPTDTPAYEKNGWTGDAQVTAETALYNFRMGPFYRKWLRDVSDAQRETGELPPFVPTSDWGYSDAPHDGVILSPNPAWDAAYVLMPWWTYRYTGDRSVLAEHYDGMKALVNYLGTYADDGIIDEGLGDWFPPGHGEPRWNPPEGPALTSTGYYYRFAEVLRETAAVLGRKRDQAAYDALADRVGIAFNDAFFDAGAGYYATGETDEYRQTSNAFALRFGLVPDGHRDAVADRLVASVRDDHDGHLDTGILGTKYLLGLLCDHGETDLAYRVATQRSYPGWGYWLENGATSFLETWELNARSYNHHMFGTVDEWFYRYLAGVRPATPGFETVTFEPVLPTELDSISATVDTVRGPVESAWERTDDGVRFELTLPPATAGRARLPGDDLRVEREGEAPADTTAPQRVDAEDGRTEMELSTGTWVVRAD